MSATRINTSQQVDMKEIMHAYYPVDNLIAIEAIAKNQIKNKLIEKGLSITHANQIKITWKCIAELTIVVKENPNDQPPTD